jgi:pantoate--beta-alanine ligase
MPGARGGHFFKGVATVVTKLFNITRPTHAYFGQKDAMQCVMIQKLARDLNFPIDVVVVPTGAPQTGGSRGFFFLPP